MDPLAEYGPEIKPRCAIDGHAWRFIGCRSCCCARSDGGTGGCSLPVHKCDTCGDCDYGENDEAARIVDKCFGTERDAA